MSRTYNDICADALDRELDAYEPDDIDPDAPEPLWLEDAREYEAAAMVMEDDEWRLFAGKVGV